MIRPYEDQRNDIFSSKFFRRPRVDLVNRVVQFSTKTRTFNGRLVFVFVSVIVLIPDLDDEFKPNDSIFPRHLERAYATRSPFKGSVNDAPWSKTTALDLQSVS